MKQVKYVSLVAIVFGFLNTAPVYSA